MASHNKISIITPCLNAENLIQRTINSIIVNLAETNNAVDLEYIVCDGGSNDRTFEIVEESFSRIESENITTTFISEKDAGMYDALAKGLKQATGDIITYINAGDFFSPHAFEIVLEIFGTEKVKWLTGFIVQYNEKSHLTGTWLPYRYKPGLIQTGLYNHRVLPFLQQEGTFWSSGLHRQINFQQLRKLRFAGDYYLWKTFSEKEDLFIVEAWLAGYKIHQGQLSGDLKPYLTEMKAIADKPGLSHHLDAIFDKLIWFAPNGIKKRLNTKTLFRYDHARKQYTL